MKIIKSKLDLGPLLMVILFIVFILFSSHVAAANKQTGIVTVATSYGAFYRKGGDTAASTGAYPLPPNEVYDSLISVNLKQRPIPSLAKSWKIAKDWSYIDFFIRDDVKFHNGAPVTTEDIKYSIETHMRPELKFLMGPLYRRNIKSIDVPNPHQVRINLNYPYPWIFTNFWLHTGIFPKKYREAVGDDGFADKPIGSGPFRWVDYKQDIYFKLEAVKKHFRKTPEIKTLIVRFVPEHSTRLAMLKAGEADIARLHPPHISQVENDPNLKIQFIKYSFGHNLTYCDLRFPDDPSPFHDIRVRKAASLAIDREAICEKILFGAAEPLGDIISPITLGFDESIKPDPYDPEAAKKLLAEAGYPKGFETVIHIGPAGRSWGEAIASNLMDIGIKAKLELYEAGAWAVSYRMKKFRGLARHFYWYNAGPHVSKDGFNFFISKMPWCYYSTPKIEGAIKKAMFARSDEDMIKGGRMVSKLIRDSRIKLPLWSSHVVFGVGPRIGYWKSAMGIPMGHFYEYLKLK